MSLSIFFSHSRSFNRFESLILQRSITFRASWQYTLSDKGRYVLSVVVGRGVRA